MIEIKEIQKADCVDALSFTKLTENTEPYIFKITPKLNHFTIIQNIICRVILQGLMKIDTVIGKVLVGRKYLTDSDRLRMNKAAVHPNILI